MQLWLVALGAVLLWRSDGLRSPRVLVVYRNASLLLALVGYGLLAGSVVLTFVAGGTVG